MLRSGRTWTNSSELPMSRPFRAQIWGVALTQGFALGYDVAPHSGLPDSHSGDEDPGGVRSLALIGVRDGFASPPTAPHSHSYSPRDPVLVLLPVLAR